MEQNFIETRLDMLLEYMKNGFEQMHVSFREINSRLTGIDEHLEDVEDRLVGVERAVDSNTLQLLDHQKRVQRIEKMA